MKGIHLELLANLKYLTVILPQTSLIDSDKLTIEPNCIKLGKSIVKFPVQVDPSSFSRSLSKDSITLKLQVLSNTHQEENEGQLLLDSFYLQSIECIKCQYCHQVLNNKGFSRLANAPSEYWHELMDCWACHKEDYSGLEGQKGGVVYAQKHAL